MKVLSAKNVFRDRQAVENLPKIQDEAEKTEQFVDFEHLSERM